jgi:hypothetical protein
MINAVLCDHCVTLACLAVKILTARFAKESQGTQRLFATPFRHPGALSGKKVFFTTLAVFSVKSSDQQGGL